ncbi:MAG: hypothetical protein K2Q21_09300 [Chitinophagaceae bacterium]|nr:hypothetical protein [Chitinophagaceae bacterium]
MDYNLIMPAVASAILASLITILFLRVKFVRQKNSFEEQLKGKIEIITNFEKLLQQAQSKKDLILTRAIKAETQLVMVKVALAESRESSFDMIEKMTPENAELVKQILDIDAKKILENI